MAKIAAEIVYLPCTLLCLLLTANSNPVEDIQPLNSLKQVHIIFRHGDRAPISPYPNSLNLNHVWEFGLGQLTNVGKNQQYQLGEFLRRRYNGFLSRDPREIEVRSSDKDRCIASAQVNLAAFFKPEGKFVWNPALIWQPVPIHTRPKAEDWVLNEDADCPAADTEAAKFPQSPEGIEYAERYRELMSELTVKSGKPVNDPTSVNSVQGVAFIERIKGLPVAEWVDRLWPQMVQASNDGFVAKYTNKKIQRLRGGPLLNHFTELMKERAAETTETTKPIAYMYSTHDAILAALMSAMGVYNHQAVPYAGTLLVELHKRPEQSDHSVRIFYRNGTTEPFALQVPACDIICPLSQFITLLQNVTPSDIKSECHTERA